MGIYSKFIGAPIKRLIRSAVAKSFTDEDDVEGGFEIFRNILGSTSAWSRSENLGAYRKSLYVFACVSKIAQKTASIDWELFKIQNSDGDKQQVFVHPALDLLYKPNQFQTKEEFVKRYMINKKLTGEAFILKIRTAPGKDVIELWNLRPDYMSILKNDNGTILGFQFMSNKGPVVFDPEDIIYDVEPDPFTEFGGMGALQAAHVRVDTEEYATLYQRNFFINNARPDFLLISEKKVSSEQKEEMKEAWEKRHKGAKNVGKGAFLEGGMSYQQIGISQHEMDYIESLKMTRDDILVAFQVPKPIIAITEDVNYSNAEVAMETFLSETIVPEIRALTNKINEGLIYDQYGDNFFLNFENPIPEDDQRKADVQTKRIASGTMLINEAREEWGDEPVVGGWSLYMPLGMQPVGGLPQQIKSRVPDKRKNVFRGRGKALEIIEKADEIKKVMIKALYEDLKKKGRLPKKAKKKEVKRLISAERRESYGNAILKSIDDKGDTMKKAFEKFAVEQKKRFFEIVKLDDAQKAVMNHDSYVEMTKSLKSDLKKFGNKEEKLTAEFSLPFIDEFVRNSGEEAMITVAPAEEFVVTDKIQKYIENRSKEIGKQITGTTVDKLASTLAEGIAAGEGITKLGDRVEAVYDEIPLYRADTIARTEATAANNLGFTEAYRQSGVANGKEWIATSDSRTRDSHLSEDGEVVGLDEKFGNGLSYPGDPSGDPAETINCRCVLGPAFIE